MNSKERRRAKRNAEVGSASTVITSKIKPKKQLETRCASWLWIVARKVWTPLGLLSTIGGVVGLPLTVIAILPSWSMGLPSTSFRPGNPFKAVFTIGNSGYLTAYDVHVVCIQNQVKYADLGGTESQDLNHGLVGQFDRIEHGDNRTVSCFQTTLGVQMFPEILSQKQISQMYKDFQKSFNDEGEYSGRDMAFKYADLEFQVSSRPFYLPLTMTKRFHVIGKPGQDGAFVWQQVSPEGGATFWNMGTGQLTKNK